MVSRVVVYELNEVPWSVIDRYVNHRPGSALAHVLDTSMSATTVNADEVWLQPWRSWPTLHRSMYTRDHESLHLGQDPDTFAGVTLWDAAVSAGKRVGLFGAMQSWPAVEFPTGGFYVPDTFARSPETFPAELSTFQRFNLAMTSENTFSAGSRLRPKQAVSAGLDLVRRGMTPRSAAVLARHLVNERRDARFKALRPAMQVLPSFDLFWSLTKRARPDLSIFFTNHVANMMHRYWGDAMDDYDPAYVRDPIFATFLDSAMAMFDVQLGRMLRYCEANPEVVLVIASSMGQDAIDYRVDRHTYAVTDRRLFLARLGVPHAEFGLAMYPRITLMFASEQEARRGLPLLGRVVTSQGPMFKGAHVSGRTLSFELNHFRASAVAPTEVWFDDEPGRPHLPLGDLGLSLRERLGGVNTASHVPEGVLLVRGTDVTPSRGRGTVDLLDVAPWLLSVIGVEAPSSMQGRAGTLAAMATASERGSSWTNDQGPGR